MTQNQRVPPLKPEKWPVLKPISASKIEIHTFVNLVLRKDFGVESGHFRVFKGAPFKFGPFFEQIEDFVQKAGAKIP